MRMDTVVIAFLLIMYPSAPIFPPYTQIVWFKDITPLMHSVMFVV